MPQFTGLYEFGGVEWGPEEFEAGSDEAAIEQMRDSMDQGIASRNEGLLAMITAVSSASVALAQGWASRGDRVVWLGRWEWPVDVDDYVWTPVA